MDSTLNELLERGRRMLAEERAAEKAQAQEQERQKQKKIDAYLGCLMDGLKGTLPDALFVHVDFNGVDIDYPFLSNRPNVFIRIPDLSPISLGVYIETFEQGARFEYRCDVTHQVLGLPELGEIIADDHWNDGRPSWKWRTPRGFFLAELPRALAMAEELGGQFKEAEERFELRIAEMRRQAEQTLPLEIDIDRDPDPHTPLYNILKKMVDEILAEREI